MNRSLPLTPRVVVQLLIVVVLLPGLPVLITQRWDWWEAWAYAAVSAIGFVLSRVLAVKRSPDILIERSRAFEHANTEPWDRVLAPLVGIGGGVIGRYRRRRHPSDRSARGARRPRADL